MEYLNLGTIKPVQNGPFQLVPDTFHGPKKDRAFAVQLTKPVLDELARNTGELPTTVGKTYDWSYGLTTLESRYLPEGFSFEDFSYDKLVEIEGLFARSWRWWQPPQGAVDLLSPEDRFFLPFLEHVIHDPDLEHIEAYRNHDTPLLLPKDELQRRLNMYSSQRPLTFDPHTGTYLAPADLSRVLDQYEKQGLTAKNARAEFCDEPNCGPQFWGQEDIKDDVMLIDLEYHRDQIKAKLPGDDTKRLFERELVVLKDPSTHPIEQAARIWFFSHKHPTSPVGSAQAGKALAGIVLLTHGYVPPTISDRELDGALERSLPSDNGVRIFTDFVARATLGAQHLPQKQNFCYIL